MRPQIFRVYPSSDYDLNGESHQYVVDFFLDCTTAWMKIRDGDGTYEAEKARCDRVLKRLGLFIKRITTNPEHRLRENVKVDMGSIVKLMVEQIAYFSGQTRKRSLQILGENLKEYIEQQPV
jgi:hypothetical protein